MLRFVQRVDEKAARVPLREPIDGVPELLVPLLRTRGIDTPEKADAFLHPTLDRLHDPFLMQDMDRAVALIRETAERGDRVVVYGDYDVDGICATTIMLETLREMGLEPAFRIPSRHEEGYGLNENAVRQLAEQGTQLLITVDNGITAHAEVRLARELGMKVIVTDHHQLNGETPEAEAVLNPLLGSYPFRFLCGAGVALKLNEALLGRESMLRRIDLAALATVADIVSLVDENRVIVREGLRRMTNSERPGIRALLKLSGTATPVTSTDLAFRLAPRLNAAGRLEDAAQGVTLMLARTDGEAEPIAAHLEENNSRRKAIEDDIVNQALAAIRDGGVDFLNDRFIVILGENWNNGVLGLAAGKLSNRFYYPAIVLSDHDGVAVGSCRSIPGVNMHRLLCECEKRYSAYCGEKLFERFGGHPMAAGLTIRTDRVPELRRLLNLLVDEENAPERYIPVAEYDRELRLGDVTLELIERLKDLEPTGEGNPSPVFLTRGAAMQSYRAVGSGRHLKMTITADRTVREGIAFGKGELANEGLGTVDLLFTPSRNEFNGRVTAQLDVKELRNSGCVGAPCGREAFFRALMQEISLLASKDYQISGEASVETVTEAVAARLASAGQGTLLLTHDPDRAAALLMAAEPDVAVGTVSDPRGFTTLLCAPRPETLTDIWRSVVLLDGDVLPGEAALIREKCPRARLYARKESPELTALLKSLAP